MLKFLKHFVSNLTISGVIILIYLFTLFIQSPFPPYKNYEHNKTCIFSDGFGYYSYLPAIFIYHDLTFSFFDSVHKKNYHYDAPSWAKSFIIDTKKGIVNKYWIGVSLLLLPFFLLSHWLSLLFGFEADGYSILYQYAVFTASFFYLYLGCRFLRLYLLKNDFSEKITSFTIFTLVFGTNLFYYSMYEPSMSHVYSFFCVSAFSYFTSKYFTNNKFKDLLITVLFLTLIVLVRPVNIIVICFIPFLAQTFLSFKQGVKALWSFRIKLLIPLLFSIGLILQMLLWYKQNGSWFVWSYPGEYFSFSDPHFIDILFSYRKGFFVYMPVFFVSLIALIHVFKNKLFQFFSLSLSILFIVYVLSSWYAWDYSACMGNRAFIDFYFFFAYLIATSFYVFKQKSWLYFLTSIYVFLIFFNNIQIYQYKHNIYHNSEMTKEKYWKVFLQTGKGYEGLLFDWSDKSDRRCLLSKYNNMFLSLSHRFENPDSLWAANHIEKKSFAFSGCHVTAVNDNSVYSDGARIPESIIKTKEKLIIDVSVKAYLYNEIARGYLVVQITQNNVTRFWKQTKISTSNASVKKWSNILYCCELPTLQKGDEVRVFVRSEGVSSVYLDDYTLRFYSY